MTTSTTQEHDVDTPAPAAVDGPRRAWLPWAVAVLAGALAIGFAVLWWQADGRASDLEAAEADRSEVALAARQVILDLTTWDAADGLDDEIDALRAQGTGPFLDEIETQFSDATGTELEDLEIASTGEIEEVFVIDIEGESADAFVMVTHTYLLPSGPDTPLLRPATVRLRLVEGEWKVQSVDLPPPDAALTGMMNQLEVGE